MSLGFKSPEHVESELSERQIRGWIDYYNGNPFGELRADLRNEINCCASYKGKKRVKMKDFRIKVKRKSGMTSEQLDKDAAAWAELRKNKVRMKLNGS